MARQAPSPALSHLCHEFVPRVVERGDQRLGRGLDLSHRKRRADDASGRNEYFLVLDVER